MNLSLSIQAFCDDVAGCHTHLDHYLAEQFILFHRKSPCGMVDGRCSTTSDSSRLLQIIITAWVQFPVRPDASVLILSLLQ